MVCIQLDWLQIEYPETTDFPSRWIAWNCDDETRGNPLPDGLMIEWYEDGDGAIQKKLFAEKPHWRIVTRFRIIGIQEGWE